MALTKGRIDQGFDIGGSGGLPAVGDGIVQSTGLWNGWPGSGGLVYQLTNGRKIYVQEGFQPSVTVGQRVKAGQILGQVIPGTATGIEEGYANAAGTGPLVPYNGLADGTPTAGGQAFFKDFGAAAVGAPTSSAPASSSSSSSGILGTGIGPNVGPDLNPVDAINGALGGLWTNIQAKAAYAGLSAVVILGGFALLALGLLRTTRTPQPGPAA